MELFSSAEITARNAHTHTSPNSQAAKCTRNQTRIAKQRTKQSNAEKYKGFNEHSLPQGKARKQVLSCRGFVNVKVERVCKQQTSWRIRTRLARTDHSVELLVLALNLELETATVSKLKQSKRRMKFEQISDLPCILPVFVFILEQLAYSNSGQPAYIS